MRGKITFVEAFHHFYLVKEDELIRPEFAFISFQPNGGAVVNVVGLPNQQIGVTMSWLLFTPAR